MNHVKCNLCGADDYEVLFEKRPDRGVAHRIVRCRHCQLMYANPQEVIDCEEYAKPEAFNDAEENSPYYLKQLVQVPDNLRALKVLNEWFPKRGHLLEVGSCTGIFLDQIRSSGWETTGLEPHRGLARHAREKFKLNVINAVLPHPDLVPGSYDAVIMLHVIEHMPDPGASIRELRRLLKPGGALVVETPRFDSLTFKILRSRERSINNCPGHIYFFTVPALRRLVEQAGFELARTELVGRTLTLDRFLYNVALMTRHPGTRRLIGNLSHRLGLSRIRFHVNFHDMQRLYFRACPPK